MTNVGFGDSDFTFAVYIGNKPSMEEYQGLSEIKPLVSGEIEAINQCCGNGWRKVFNVYAKILYALNHEHFNFSNTAPTWQEYRDNYLLQNMSHTALLFSPLRLDREQKVINIICGKGHATFLMKDNNLVDNLEWLDNEFAIDRHNKLIVCPYFDYRQISNRKIERLSKLIDSLKAVK